MNKFNRIRDLIAERGGNDLKILDIGCRRKELQPFVENFGLYHGADLFQSGSVEYVGDFTKGLPIQDQEYDVTVAADVIEHAADMTLALDEMMRVTKRIGIVILPNHGHWTYRLRFLVTSRLSNKWDIEFPIPLDRHRWLTTSVQCGPYMHAYASSRGIKVEVLDAKIGWIGPLIEKSIGRIWPNFWNRNLLYVLSRNS